MSDEGRGAADRERVRATAEIDGAVEGGRAVRRQRIRSGTEAELSRGDGIARQRETVVPAAEGDIARQLAVRDIDRVATASEQDVTADDRRRESRPRQPSA